MPAVPRSASWALRRHRRRCRRPPLRLLPCQPTALPPFPSPGPQLVLINISDHHTRTLANAGPDAAGGAGAPPPPRVLGCLLGSQAGRTVDITNSFEMRFAEGSAAEIDQAFLQKKMEQCGWRGRPP